MNHLMSDCSLLIQAAIVARTFTISLNQGFSITIRFSIPGWTACGFSGAEG